MTLDDEIKILIAGLPNPPEIIDKWEEVADLLSGMFEWIGSKIDWRKAIEHSYQRLPNDKSVWPSLVVGFINENNLTHCSKEIFYINDSSLDYALKITADEFNSMLALLIENVPQHHYFFDVKTRWCLSITSEGYMDLGFSAIPK
ncbi:type IV secretion protein Rhs [Serratia marcescens]|uniref:type IV secretion protein Rhs n=1 Tax=Serratia marcescens TaxID=615 RepID=UPI000E2C7513|nr:type IV secretion protein Rhs [Serratia marcescens]